MCRIAPIILVLAWLPSPAQSQTVYDQNWLCQTSTERTIIADAEGHSRNIDAPDYDPRDPTANHEYRSIFKLDVNTRTEEVRLVDNGAKIGKAKVTIVNLAEEKARAQAAGRAIEAAPTFLHVPDLVTTIASHGGGSDDYWDVQLTLIPGILPPSSPLDVETKFDAFAELKYTHRIAEGSNRTDRAALCWQMDTTGPN